MKHYSISLWKEVPSIKKINIFLNSRGGLGHNFFSFLFSIFLSPEARDCKVYERRQAKQPRVENNQSYRDDQRQTKIL